MLGRGISVVVIMSHVLGNALEWFPVRITQLHLVSCCTAVLDVLATAVLVQQVQQICCTGCTAVLDDDVLLYLMYCCTAGAQRRRRRRE